MGVSAQPIHVYVSLQRDADGYPPFDTEELDAVELDDASSARILTTPAFAYGLARGDVVELEQDSDGRRWVTRVNAQSDHWCARVVTFGPTEPRTVIDRFTTLGCAGDGPRHGLLCIDVPPTADAPRVLEALAEGRASGAWDFDLGVAPPTAD